MSDGGIDMSKVRLGVNEIPQILRDRAISLIPPIYRDRGLEGKYLQMRNMPTGLASAADQIEHIAEDVWISVDEAVPQDNDGAPHGAVVAEWYGGHLQMLHPRVIRYYRHDIRSWARADDVILKPGSFR